MKTLLTTFSVALLAVAANAEPPAKGEGAGKGKGPPGGRPPQEVIAIMKKYDTNGDKKLDEKERAAMSDEDKATLAKFRERMGKGGPPGKGKGEPKGKGKGKGKGEEK
ncbi:MAG: hypothetical protein R3F13_21105 [Prosthecobacter sp.]